MPLLDHFRGGLDDIYNYNWEAIHAAWATRIADSLNQILPANFTAIERQRFGTEIEIDVTTYETVELEHASLGNGKATAVLEAPIYAPPVVHKTIAAEFPDIVEVRVFLLRGAADSSGPSSSSARATRIVLPNGKPSSPSV